MAPALEGAGSHTTSAAREQEKQHGGIEPPCEETGLHTSSAAHKRQKQQGVCV